MDLKRHPLDQKPLPSGFRPERYQSRHQPAEVLNVGQSSATDGPTLDVPDESRCFTVSDVALRLTGTGIRPLGCDCLAGLRFAVAFPPNVVELHPHGVLRRTETQIVSASSRILPLVVLSGSPEQLGKGLLPGHGHQDVAPPPGRRQGIDTARHRRSLVSCKPGGLRRNSGRHLIATVPKRQVSPVRGHAWCCSGCTGDPGGGRVRSEQGRSLERRLRHQGRSSRLTLRLPRRQTRPLSLLSGQLRSPDRSRDATSALMHDS